MRWAGIRGAARLCLRDFGSSTSNRMGMARPRHTQAAPLQLREILGRTGLSTTYQTRHRLRSSTVPAFGLKTAHGGRRPRYRWPIEWPARSAPIPLPHAARCRRPGRHARGSNGGNRDGTSWCRSIKPLGCLPCQDPASYGCHSRLLQKSLCCGQRMLQLRPGQLGAGRFGAGLPSPQRSLLCVSQDDLDQSPIVMLPYFEAIGS